MPGKMQAVVKAHAAPGIEIREVPVPSPGPGEVLVACRRPVSAEPTCISTTGIPGPRGASIRL